MRINVAETLRRLGIGFRKQGRELWARCPFPGHESDGTPSWSIVDGGDRNGQNHCFGCGASGGALDLIVEVVGLSSYKAAAEWARERGLVEDEEGGIQDVALVSRRPAGRKGTELPEPLGLIKSRIGSWPTPARRYAEKRGLDDQSVARWGIACAVDGDLAGRIWIPTRDRDGRLLDWTARSWCGDDLRYKSAEGGGVRGAVFGERYWPAEEERGEAELAICEGAFDALACERVGARNIAGLGGVAKYDRWTAMKMSGWGTIVVAVDPDGAGDRVAELLEFLGRLPGVRSLRRAELPAGEDCDRVWRRSPAILRRILFGSERGDE